MGREPQRHPVADGATGHRLRRISDGPANGPVPDWRLRVPGVSFLLARASIARRHQHVGASQAWRIGASIWNGHVMIGVSTLGNQVASALNERTLSR